GPAFLSVGSHSASRRRLGAVHLGELDRRANWLLHKNPHHPFARTHSRSGSNYRRHHRLASGEPAFRRASDLALPRDCAGHCGNEINLHEVASAQASIRRAEGAASLLAWGTAPECPTARAVSAESATHLM